MAEHYTANTESVTLWCNHCNRRTQHSVSGGRAGRCMEHSAPQFSKKQQAQQQKIEKREGEGLGRNIKTQLVKATQSKDLAPCGDPNCAGCYEVLDILADGMELHPRIHPPRSDY